MLLDKLVPFDTIMQSVTSPSGEVDWTAMVDKFKKFAGLMPFKMGEGPKAGAGASRTAAAMEKMMARMADTQSQDVEWRARIGSDPIRDAFECKKFAHASGDVQVVPPPMVPAASNLLTRTRRTTRSAVYINVPFCQTRCAFCMFYIGPYKKEESERYSNALIKEIKMWSDTAAGQGKPIHAVYLGGGTPTALEASDLQRILTAVREHLPLSNDCEITVEGRLSYFDARKMEACLAGGANRFSLGVQTFDTDIRQSVGRLSGREELIAGLETLCSYDEAAVVIDLIFGLPGQTMQTWLKDLDTVTQLPIHGVDLYQLIVLQDSPLERQLKNGKFTHAPDNLERADMYRAGCEFMQSAQWKQLSVSHFARTTRERNLYNVLAKSDADMLAFGPGAGGKIQGASFMNVRNYKEYLDRIEHGDKAVAMMFLPKNRQWRLYKDLGEQLELGFLDLTALQRRHGLNVAELASEVLQQWQEAGLLTLQGRFVQLTLAGKFWAVTMIQLLTNYLQQKLQTLPQH